MEKCCVNCIDDSLLRYKVFKIGLLDNCNFCKSKDIECIKLDHEIFNEIFIFIKKMYIEHPIRRSRQLYYLVQEDWGIFENSFSSENLFKKLCKLKGVDSESYYTVNPDYRNIINIWDDYKETIKHKNRFLNTLPKEIEELFSTYFNERYTSLHTDNVLFRARLGGKDKYDTIPFDANLTDMGMPPINKARAGRANPDGIPYLYLASSKETAIAEVRPWSGSTISIATINLKESLNTINFSVFHKKSIIDYLTGNDLESAISRIKFFDQLGIELSKPVSPNDSYLEYIPTQFLTEFINYRGFDGMIFDSSLGDAQNVVLFNQDNIEVITTDLSRVDSINYNFNDIG